MMDEKLLGRITANPEIFGGKPIIRGMRISVEMILSLLAQGEYSSQSTRTLDNWFFSKVIHTVD
jgi:uncharacterized protein (DUF433 family)